MAIGDFAEAFDFGCDYLQECGGSEFLFHNNITDNIQRIGQAFFNALSPRDQEKIEGHITDPFHSNDPECVFRAIEFLMDH